MFINYKKYSEEKPITVSYEEVYEKIKADKKEKPLKKSENFWKVYEELKNYHNSEHFRATTNDPEVKARNMLKSLLQKPQIQSNEELQTFLKNLIKDIEDYGTIPLYTLKEISQLDLNKVDRCIDYLNKLMEELGGADFLENYKINGYKTEVLIAVENISD